MDQISKKIKMISEKLKELKNKFNLNKIDGYVVPKNDEYFSEFSKKDKLKTITGFDGSFGLAIILKKKNFLFVDGRYVEQAKIQAGKKFKILEIPKKLPYQVLNSSLNLGFDPMISLLEVCNITLEVKLNLPLLIKR